MACIYILNVEEGRIAVKLVLLWRKMVKFDIIIEGKSAHGAQPHNGVDAIVAAAEYITNVQSILPRFINPIEPGVVTIGKITGGERCNVIPKHVLLEGTIRTFSADVYDTIKDKLKDFAKSIEIGHGCKVQPVFRDMYPAVNNDEHLYSQFIDAVGVENTEKIDPKCCLRIFHFTKHVCLEFSFLWVHVMKRKDLYIPFTMHRLILTNVYC